MKQRVFTRRVAWYPLLAAFLAVAVFLTTLGLAGLLGGDNLAGAIAVSLGCLAAALAVMAWRVSHVAVSVRGVTQRPDSLAAFVRPTWLAWAQIERFEREELAGRPGMAERVVALTTNGERVAVCQIPFLIIDTSNAFDSAIEYVLDRLESARASWT